MKKIVMALSCLLMAQCMWAQSKVFKEVSSEVSSSMEAIVQDGNLVGYLVFTRLEKASEDSFNYKVSIMDENLNDIGVVNFKEEDLELQAVSFEQDILCLAYLKSTIQGQEFKSTKAMKSASQNAKNAVITQFLDLTGKVVKQNAVKVNIPAEKAYKVYTGYSRFKLSTNLKHSIELTNIPGKGFVCIFGDDDANTMIVYNAQGEQQWTKKIDDASLYSLLTTSEDVFLLAKKKEKMLEGGYTISAYSVSSNSNHYNYELKDKDGRSLKVLSFGTDQATGKPYVSGNIIHSVKGNNFETAKQISRGPYVGVFTVNFTGTNKSDIKEVYSYWGDGSQEPSISKKGKFTEDKIFMHIRRAVRDQQGNTYFVGSSFVKKPKWGVITACLITAPTVVIPLFIAATAGTVKVKVKDGMILKQDAKGALSVENNIDGNKTSFYPAKLPMSFIDSKRYYPIYNSTNKTNYVIMDDVKDITIYNINQKKVVRKISHKDGNSRINIYPAKEGHIMVSEYNSKEKYTRMSIEAL